MDQYQKTYYKTYGLDPVPKSFLDKQEVENLFKRPKKDSYINEPHTQLIEPGYVAQADLLFLPNDDGYKYALVVVDVGSRLTDAEPIKEKSSNAVKKAFKKIFDREIISIPNRIETDPGSEFKGDVKKYFENMDVRVKYSKPGRHRQIALVERRNQVIGKVLMKKMTAEELLTNKVSRRWVHMLPRVIKAMNKHYGQIAELMRNKKNPNVPVCEGDACKLLEVNTKVRVILDEPRAVTGEKLIGKFRSGDIRWDPNIRYIKQILLKPNKPPMYLLNNKKEPDGVDKIPYTKNQLQVISENEQDPVGKIVLADKLDDPEMTWVVKNILGKRKYKGKWQLLIRWKGFGPEDDSWESYNEIKKYYPDLVKQFEKNNN